MDSTGDKRRKVTGDVGPEKIQMTNAPPMARTLLVLSAIFGCACYAFSADLFAVDSGEAGRLIASKKYGEAIDLLRAASDEDDIYPCDCWDAPHKHRSSARRLLIVDCLLALDRKEEGRKELRSLYEARVEPAYIIPGKADILLIELETEHGYEAFDRWLEKHRPVEAKFYQGSTQHIVSLKKAIENGRFDGSLDILRGVEAYHIFLAPRRLTWQQEAVTSYVVRNPKSLPFLLRQMSTHRDGRIYDLDRGVIFCLGEMANVEAIPALRRAMETEKNSYTRLELVFALAKCGDKEVIPTVYAHKAGNVAHQRYIDQLLRRLTGKDFGVIENQDDATAVLEKWGAYFAKHGEAQPSAPADSVQPAASRPSVQNR